MNVEKIFELSQRNPELTEIFSFKLNPTVKEDFFEVCRKQGLSTGAVMRSLLAEFLREAKK